MVEKTIIANYGQPNLGKTESVKLVYVKLEKLVRPADIKVLHAPKTPEGDICAIITINKIKVGISSLGDWCPEHSKWLEELVQKDCRIVIAACQHSGKTVNNITKYAPNYRIWWSSNARLYEAISKIGPRSIQKQFNEQWAEEIANLVDGWCYA